MIDNGKLLWEKLLGNLHNFIPNVISEQAFETWIKPARFLKFEGGVLYIELPNKWIVDWVEEYYLDGIKGILKDIAGFDVNLRFLPKEGITEENKHIEVKEVKDESNLYQEHTFDNFIVGKSNHFAHAGAFAVAKSPGSAYNPLFVYGGVGLGKTHLIMAIGNYVKTNYPNLSVRYIGTENFMTEMIYAIQNRQTVEFKNRYREVDVLLIDDIHFLSGKESLQEEIFHTFNTLYNAKKQIVITSDKSPEDIPKLEERIVSRLQWGLVVDIQPPDFETRMAILRNKAEKDGLNIDDEVLFFIASNVKTNIRDLEGCVIKLLAYSSMEKQDITLDKAKEVLTYIVKDVKKNITIDFIQEVVADYYQLTKEKIISSERTKKLVLVRQIAMYLSREMLSVPLKEIGDAFGKRDHTTVMYSIKKLEKLIKKDKKIKEQVINLKQRIKGG